MKKILAGEKVLQSRNRGSMVAALVLYSEKQKMTIIVRSSKRQSLLFVLVITASNFLRIVE